MSSDNNNNNNNLVSEGTPLPSNINNPPSLRPRRGTAPQFGTLSEEREREQLGENRARQAASAANLLSEVEAEASAIGLTSPPDILRGENSRAQGLRDTPPSRDGDLRIPSGNRPNILISMTTQQHTYMRTMMHVLKWCMRENQQLALVTRIFDTMLYANGLNVTWLYLNALIHHKTPRITSQRTYHESCSIDT